ncbi:hypothetical protein [Methylobacterium dankookense]|uniref:Uncharacterized protein n=1 Tax=Methylobacterium dankookense TaxID=560405 RepID=A0A564FU27_9HYPH|nr:hypothetical protein [Methylobacterium dankookense]GJD56043.1 hypothetical protein IFDJLNFL_1935 [Methylobacterium dankookense]VUF11364.1 hypothetical protein MTDSW087_01045 [Methylobacterium dankookense]
MRAALLAGLAVLAAAPASAGPLEAGSSCGGNAYSSAQVVEGRSPRREPLVAVPDTLCADLDGPRPPVRVDIYGVPGLGPESGSGADGSGAPYEGRSRRGARPVPLPD